MSARGRQRRPGAAWSRAHWLTFGTAGAFVVFVGLYLWAVYTAPPSRFDDPGLEAAVRSALELEGRGFAAPELERITELDASERGITTLSGIEQLSNLAVLDLRGNRVQDLSPLSSLSRLRELSLRDNDMVDLSAANLALLAELPALRVLNLRHNRGPSHPERPDVRHRLSDISVLAEFTQLESLDLADNEVSDVTAIAGLTRLRSLSLRDNPLDLENLVVLSGLTQLEYLNLRNTGLRDLSGVQEFRNLGHLDLRGNSDLSSIVPLASLPRLHTLVLRDVPVAQDVHVLESLPSLLWLDLRNTGVADLMPLARLMEQGALQDDASQGRFAYVDIRENPVHAQGAADGYQVLEPFWDNIAMRSPQTLPPPMGGGSP